MNDITKRKVERINQITDHIAKLEAELVALLGGSGQSDNVNSVVAPTGTKIAIVKKAKRELTKSEIEKIKKSIIDLVQKHKLVHHRFVYEKIRTLGYRLNIISVAQRLRHLRDDGKLHRGKNGLYSSVDGVDDAASNDNTLGNEVEKIIPNGFTARPIV